jgi:hypothetical protein
VTLLGPKLTLGAYPADTITNRRFAGVDLGRLDRFYLPAALAGLVDRAPEELAEFVEDDNRSAISPEPLATLDGDPFYLSVKGIGSAVQPFAHAPLDRTSAAMAAGDSDLRRRLSAAPATETDRIITGEIWLRGSPYGGQGLPHARTALDVSERADLTSLAGFRIGPVVKVSFLPPELEGRLREIRWFRRYRGRFVQELRLVPSNVRVYFHGRESVAHRVRAVFDQFGIDTASRGLAFETNFVRSGIAVLSLFARTMERATDGHGWTGLDFEDVWLDKDAVLAPSGAVYFVDLEGISPTTVEPERVREKIEDQVYRSLYELMFAYEQIEGERSRRWGGLGGRTEHFTAVVESALASDPYARPRRRGRDLVVHFGPPDADESLCLEFPFVDL